jgi:hypothetical protein
MTDMNSVIVPKSDQINADDLLGGPITVKIAGVKVRPGQEQPVAIAIEGTPKVYRPCKSMARVLVSAWGPDSSQYLGRSMTLYCDPKVKWGGMEVGGIRISHMTDIDSAITMALTITRANKKPYTVRPLKAATKEPAPQAPILPGADAPTVLPDGEAPTAEAGTHDQKPMATNGYPLYLPGSTEDPAVYADQNAWWAKWAEIANMIESSKKLQKDTKLVKLRALKDANERVIRSMGAAMTAKISGDMATRTANINAQVQE